jgi:hypothetical protein
MLQPGAVVTSFSFSYRYCFGFASTGVGSNFTLKLGSSAVYTSPHFTDYPYNKGSDPNKVYSPPVNVTVDQLSITIPSSVSRIGFDFENVARNVQLMLPMTITITCAGGSCLTPSFMVMVPDSLHLIVDASHPGSAGNKFGYEDGSVVRAGGKTHMLVSELIGDPHWIKMRLGHWTTNQTGGDSGWERRGTIVLDGAPMVSTANCSDTISHTAALWSPILFFENQTWFMTYVGYNCGRGYSNANTDGQIKLAQSTIAGPDGAGGPFKSVKGVLLARGPAGGNQSQAWEGKQGDDSFFAFKAPATGNSSREELLAFYGSSPFGWPWNVGLARSKSGLIAGPWQRLPVGNPLALDGSKVENPIVLRVPQAGAGVDLLVMVHDWVSGGKAGFGVTWSHDGVHWANSTMVAVPGGVEAPMGILPSLTRKGGLTVWWNKRGGYDCLYAAQFDLNISALVATNKHRA